MKSVVSLEEFRENLSEYVSHVMYGNQTVLVQKHKRSGVVVMSEQEYEKLRDPRKRFTTETDWNAFFDRAAAIRARMSTEELKEFDQVVHAEVAAVRAMEGQGSD